MIPIVPVARKAGAVMTESKPKKRPYVLIEEDGLRVVVAKDRYIFERKVVISDAMDEKIVAWNRLYTVDFPETYKKNRLYSDLPTQDELISWLVYQLT